MGPRPFERDDRARFFGRDQEIRRLAALIVARRVVLLYARSGAGKTSLLRAGLLPHLEERKKLRVRGICRVGDELTAELDRYLEAPPEETPSLLVLDQLEELFHPEHGHDEHVELFRRLGRGLDRHPRLSLLLSLREDYVAWLDPLAALLPDRLRTRFRLELLDESAARSAIQGPARSARVDIDDQTARQLVDELRKIRIQAPDGRTAERLGSHVEPVQLQVVCARWWSTMGSAGEIADLPASVPVDRALADYYDERLAAVASAGRAGERRLRDWIDECLITGRGLRGQVLREAGATRGLEDAAVQALVDAHLLRTERRRGATWIELAHDRLVEPVRTSNAAWREAHLRPMQRRAAWWIDAGRPPGLLLARAELEDELSWAAAHDGELTATEKDFLAASVGACEEAVRSRRLRRLGWLAAVVVLVLAGTLWQLWRERQSRRRELVRGLAAHALSRLDDDLDLALLLSLEANRLDASVLEARSSLLAGLQHQPRLLGFLHGHEDTVWSVAFSPQPDVRGRVVLASGGRDHRIVLWDIESRERLGSPLEGHDDGILSLAFSPDGRRLVSTGRDGQVRLWNLTTEPKSRVLADDRIVTDVVFASGSRLIAGDIDGRVLIWEDVTQDPPSDPVVVGHHGGPVTSLAIGPRESELLVSGGTDHAIRIWRDGHADQLLWGHDDWVTGLAWNPGGRYLVSAGLDRTVRRWDMETSPPVGEILEGPSDRVSGVAISQEGKLVAATTANGWVYLWDAETGRLQGPPLRGGFALTSSPAFSPDGRLLAAGNGSAVVLWDVADLGDIPPTGLGRRLGAGEVRSVAFSPDGSLLAVSGTGDGGEVRLFEAETGKLERRLVPGFPEPAQSVTFRPDSRTVLAFGDDGRGTREVRSWNRNGRRLDNLLSERIPSGIARDPDTTLSRLGDYAGILEESLRPRRSGECVTVRTVTFEADGTARAAESLPPAAAERPPRLTRWNLSTSRPKPLRLDPSGCVRGLAVSPDGALAFGDDTGTITLLDTGEEALIESTGGPIRSLAFSADGLLASGSDDGIVGVWDRATGSRLRSLVGHPGSIHALAFGPLGRILASADRFGNILLWDVAGGIALGRPLRGHRGPVSSLAFSPDGAQLASGGKDGTLLWDVDFESWRQRACRIANRELTPEESDLFVGSWIPQPKPACLE